MIENKIIESMLSEEELLDIAMGVTPIGAAGSIKNIFKLGKPGLQLAKNYIQKIGKLPKKQGNIKLYNKASDVIKKELNTNRPISQIYDMARSRIALENQIEKVAKGNKLYAKLKLKKKLKQYEYLEELK
tara:strand:- start:641 stop:1030 length:390 start_codon:yes stop_codon:yes gene_type:complete